MLKIEEYPALPNIFSSRLRNSFFLLSLLLLISISSCSPTKYLKEDEHFLKKYEIVADDKKVMDFSPNDYVKQKPNKKMAGLYPYAMIYNLVNPEKMEKREEKRKPKEDKMNMKRLAKGKETKEKFKLDRWLHKIGEAPVVYSESQTHKTSQQITTLLKNKGYFNAKTTDSTFFNKKLANVKYSIKAGNPYTIRNYNDSIEDPEIAKILKSYFLKSQVKPGATVDVSYFDTERGNITDLLLENGYYRFSKEYIFFEVDTFVGDYQADVKITIKNPVEFDGSGQRTAGKHKKYYFKDVSIFPDYKPDAIIKKQDQETIVYDTIPGKNNVTFLVARKNKYTTAVLTRGLTIYDDSLYRASIAKGSFGYYSSLANFRLINFDFYEPEGLISNDSSKNYLNSRIKLTPLTPQSFTIELEGNTTAGKFGMASNLLYQHLNVFGGAEILDMKFKVELNNQAETQAANSYFSETEVGITTSLRFPNMVSPFSTRSFYLKYFPKTAISLGYNFRYNSDYRRNILSATFGYDWRSSNTFTHVLDLLDFSSVKLKDMSFEYLQDLLTNGQFIEKYNHMILGSSYTFTYNTQKIKKKSDFHFLKTRIELAGNIIYMFNKLANSPQLGYGDYQAEVLKTYYPELPEDQVNFIIDSLNNSRPAFYTLGGVPYSQYFKTEIDFRYYQILNSKNEIVYRINPGIILPYGNSFYSPQEKMFFLGGASSMRAWPARSLGPGSYVQPVGSKLYQYGDLKLEANIEYRFNLFWMIEAALFSDAGNIWTTGKYEEVEEKKFELNRFYKEIALGVGIGFRFDFSFFVFRFDFGFKQHDPALSEGHRWLGMTGFTDKNNRTMSFGIGYPF